MKPLYHLEAPPETLGPYAIGRRIGGGGMGHVYEATHRALGRQVAIKLLHRTSEEHVGRFIAEARIANSIRHRGIVDIYDIGTAPDGTPYIVMELLEGADLATMLAKNKRIDEGLAIEIAIQAAKALAAAHARGVVHRDLKPENIFLSPGRGSTPRVTVLDFGVAKACDTGATVAGQILGTPLYMAPEQHFGADQADPRSDVYALGCILYEMLLGRPPFTGLGAEVMAKHQHARPKSLSLLGAKVSPRLEELVMRMLSKRPGDRPSNMGQVIRDLIPVRHDRRRRRPTRERVSSWTFAASRIAIGLVAGLALAALVATFVGHRAPASPDQTSPTAVSALPHR